MGTETNFYSWTQNGYKVQNLDIIAVLQPCLLYNDIKTGKILCFETVSVRTLGEQHNNETLVVLETPFFSHHPGKGLGAFTDVGRKVCSSGLERIPWGPFTCIFFFLTSQIIHQNICIPLVEPTQIGKVTEGFFLGVK